MQTFIHRKIETDKPQNVILKDRTDKTNEQLHAKKKNPHVKQGLRSNTHQGGVEWALGYRTYWPFTCTIIFLRSNK